MGLCFEGHPRQPQKVLIPAVLAGRNLYGPASAAFSLTPSARAFVVEDEEDFHQYHLHSVHGLLCLRVVRAIRGCDNSKLLASSSMGTFGISWSAFSPKISARKTMFSNVLAVTVFSRCRPRSIDLPPNKKALYRINDERLCSTEATLPL
jgi:hypothetical protein